MVSLVRFIFFIFYEEKTYLYLYIYLFSSQHYDLLIWIFKLQVTRIKGLRGLISFENKEPILKLLFDIL